MTSVPKPYRVNRDNEPSGCDCCEIAVRREPWCMCLAAAVSHAYEEIEDPTRIRTVNAFMFRGVGLPLNERPWPLGELIDEHCPAMELMLEMASLGMACRA
jgi:hypothetical protein